MDPTQAPPDGPEPLATPDAGLAAAGEPAPTAPVAGPAPPSPQAGLLAWVGLVLGGALLCLALGHPEAALFFAGAGVFALAQATDAAVAFQGYRHWVRDQLPERSGPGLLVRVVVRALVPVTGALFYLGVGAYTWQSGAAGSRTWAAVWCFAAAAVSLALVSRTLADRLTRLAFRVEVPTRTQRLTARLVVLGLLLPPPMQALMPELMRAMRESVEPLASPAGLVAQLVGEVAVALAGVGWLVRRRWREVAERLGLGPVRATDLGLIVLGLAAAAGINSGMEALQHHFQPALWRQDQEVSRLIVGDMPVWTALVLGISAGVGEEVTLRGALQPRLGIVLTAVFFACGHVQYSWWGMVTIGLLGAMLGLVRRRSNTSVAILVHALYDIFAVVTSKSG